MQNVSQQMDLMWKPVFKSDGIPLDGSVDSLPTSVPSKFAKPGSSWIQKQVEQQIEPILSSYCNDEGVGLPDEELDIELYYGCEYGLFNLCFKDTAPDVVQWKCISKPGEAAYEKLRRRSNREEFLKALGIGTPAEHIPESIQKAIYKKMRPATATSGTQSTSNMSDTGSQTYWSGLSCQDAETQIVTQTADCGVQVKPETAEFGANTSPVQILTKSGKRMQPPPETTSPVSSEEFDPELINIEEHLITIQVNNIEPVVVTVGDKTTTLNEEDSNFLRNIVREELKKSAMRTRNSSGDTVVDPHALEKGPVYLTNEACQLPLKGGSGDLQGSMCHRTGSEVGSKMGKCQESVEKSNNCNAGKMTEGESVVRYHPELPFHKHSEKFLSASSPFSKFGYNIIGYIPETLTDIKIPVVHPNDVTLEKGSHGLEVLGSGSFGSVLLAKHQHYPFDVCLKEFEMDSATIYDIYHEAKLLIYLQTTKFVPFCLGLMESPFLSSDLSLIQECFARGCTLKMLLKNKPEVFDKIKWIAICYQLFWGLKMIHEKQVLLNDIKSDNVLVDYNSKDLMNNIRFIDLGIASYRRGYRFCNDPAYLEQFENYAPEIRQGHHSTPASDLYAVGYLVDRISETFRITELDLIAQECTVEDPNVRPSCHSVLEKIEDIMETM